VDGLNKYHCIFGGGPSFIVHPSDSAPALMALGASLDILGPNGKENVALAEFYELPVDNIRREHILEPNQIITAVKVPQLTPGAKSTYLKFREKQSLDFAIVSVAAVLQMEGKVCQKASIVLGGVAPVPWRAEATEAELNGKTLTADVIKKAAEAAVDKALPMKQNAYKIQLAKVMVKRALEKLAVG
jgi:xanthine dehydrogenase YagS FAD-binding subunit